MSGYCSRCSPGLWSILASSSSSSSSSQDSLAPRVESVHRSHRVAATQTLSLAPANEYWLMNVAGFVSLRPHWPVCQRYGELMRLTKKKKQPKKNQKLFFPWICYKNWIPDWQYLGATFFPGKNGLKKHIPIDRNPKKKKKRPSQRLMTVSNAIHRKIFIL